MDLPTTGTFDETSVLIDAKLREMGRKPSNVQVLLTKDSYGKQMLSLRDVDATFVDAGPLHEERDGGAHGDSEDRDKTEGVGSGSEASSEHGSWCTNEELTELKVWNEELLASNTDLRCGE